MMSDKKDQVIIGHCNYIEHEVIMHQLYETAQRRTHQFCQVTELTSFPTNNLLVILLFW